LSLIHLHALLWSFQHDEMDGWMDGLWNGWLSGMPTPTVWMQLIALRFANLKTNAVTTFDLFVQVHRSGIRAELCIWFV